MEGAFKKEGLFKGKEEREGGEWGSLGQVYKISRAALT
jgi:hypothetical protein